MFSIFCPSKLADFFIWIDCSSNLKHLLGQHIFSVVCNWTDGFFKKASAGKAVNVYCTLSIGCSLLFFGHPEFKNQLWNHVALFNITFFLVIQSQWGRISRRPEHQRIS